MNVVERAKNLLMQPKTEWPVIAAEPQTVQGIYTQYVMILAAIPAVASFIGYSLVGFGSYRLPIGAGIAHLVMSYLLGLGSVYLMALIIDALAPTFGGEKNFMQAFKVAAFSPTAAWIAGVFSLIPALAILGILGLYSLYLLFIGLPMLMKVPEEKAIPYLLVVIVVFIVVGVVVAALSAMLIPSPIRGF